MTASTANPPAPSNSPPRSPSPPPIAPIALTPGPRATAFTTLYQKTLAATLKAISYDAFAACFPEIAERAPGALRAYHGQFLGRLEGLAKEEFATIVEERNIVHHLNKLEDIIATARYRKAQSSSDLPPSDLPEIPSHTQPPPALLKANLTPHLQSQQSLLNARLQTVESQNAQAAKRIMEQRKEIEVLVGGLERLIGDLEGAGEGLGEEAEEMASGSREVEQVLRG